MNEEIQDESKETTSQEEQPEVETQIEVVEPETQETEEAASAEDEVEFDYQSVIDDLKEQNQTLQGRFMRARADLENFKKRSEREKKDSIKFANKQIFTDLLSVLDNFERAMAAVTDPQDNFVVGVGMILKQLMDVLLQNGVEEIKAEGQKFDPYLHEAIAQEPTDQHEENTIMEVFQKGFTFQGVLLRPSKVTVSVSTQADGDEET